MIEIHSHILPGLDDGATELDIALTMSKQAVLQGIHTIIATPHHANGRFDNELSAVARSVRSMNGQLQERGIPLHILSGQEIRLNRNLFDELDKGVIGTLDNSEYMLLELPTGEIPVYTKEYLHELAVMGITSIIAHPERNREIARDPSKLLELIELGALSQITAQSVTGGFGHSIQIVSLELCRHHLAHFISSDAHNASSRPFGLQQAYAAIEERLGSSYVDIFQDNAECIPKKASITRVEPTLTKHKWYQFWK